MQWNIIDLLQDAKNRVERAKEAIKLAIEEQQPLPTQKPTVIIAGENPVPDIPTVFISYSRKNEREKDKLVEHLEVLGKAGLIELWTDDRIGAGGDWKREIREAIERAKVAILLISAKFLTSDFVLNEEVPALLERREKEGLVVFPVIARSCAWQSISWLEKMNVRPKNGNAIWSSGARKIDEELTAIAKEVDIILKKKL